MVPVMLSPTSNKTQTNNLSNLGYVQNSSSQQSNITQQYMMQ